MLVFGRLRRLGFPITVAVVGLVATALVTLQMRRTARFQDAERFDVAVDRLLDSIEDRLELYVASLRAGAGLLSAADLQTPEQFRTFVDRLELAQRYPGVQGIGYTRRIPAGQLAELVARQREHGREDFHVWPETPRAEYHSILYLEPLDRRNQAAIGYDMFTEPTRRAAMERARDTGEPAASAPVTLVQEIDEEKQPGFLIYVPVYGPGVQPRTVAERRQRLQGFVYSPFRTGDLFAGILGRNRRPRAGFELYDGTPEGGTLLHRTTVDEGGQQAAIRQFTVAGRPWTARVFSSSTLDRSSTGQLVPLVAGTGVVISLVLSWLAMLQVRARERAQLSELAAGDASRRFQEQTETLQVVNQTGAQLAAELDLDRLVQAVTDAATKITRAQFGAFFYNRINEEGESYTLYALSGVPRSAFAGFPMPRNTAVFGPTFRGEQIVRSDDITADPRYGRNPPYNGMPAGHLPVRSYLAVPVKSRSGEVIGGLFFGHSTAGVFTEQAEHIVSGVAAQAAIAIDNAGLYGQVQALLRSERTARADAERVSRMKDEFLATLSHELRTPLNAIVGWAHMLSSGTVTPARQQRALDTILRNARIQSQLIEDLLDMSRIISGRIRVDLGTVSVVDVVNAAMDVVRPTATAKGIDLLFTTDSVCAVYADAGRLQQIVWNLLTNAVKFTPQGGRVSVRIGERGGQAVITVSDTGIGIAPDFLPHVFDRFRQADGSLTRGHGGLGLGLSIVKSLVEMHAGSISAQSAGLNQGATFTVTLPAIQQTDETVGSAEQRFAAAGTRAFQSRSILIVDDDVDAGDLAEEILSQRGAQVAVARSAAEGLKLLTELAGIELIVTDLGMPGMDGYEFIKQARAMSVATGTPIPAIALTAHASPQDRARALASGFDVHLAKPFAPGDLLAACASLLDQQRS